MDKLDKELLFQDLCARLPYGVRIYTKEGNKDTSFILKITDLNWIFEDNRIDEMYEHDGWKPYLRPMSSMTEEERNELESITFPLMEKDWDGNENPACIRWIDIPKYMDFILSHYFDYCGLIEKGLALEAKDGMYKTK